MARTTVLKTMQRLEAKGLLTRVGGGSPIRFRATMNEKRVLPTLVRRFVERTLGGAPGPLVAYLADSQSLSPTDVAALQAIARKAEDNMVAATTEATE